MPAQDESTLEGVRLLPGTKRRLLDASPSAAEPWYINDHTLIQDRGGRWHVFGIWHPEPADPLGEDRFLHASADDLTGAPWTIHDPVLPARTEIGETHVWAPHVIEDDGLYRMVYAGGTADRTAYRMTLATSEDLFTWTPHEPVLFEDGFDARDPMVIRDGTRWLLYYTRTSTPAGGFHQVAVRTSEDLLTWSRPQVAYESTVAGTDGGPTESPFVVRAGGGWLLFLCESGEYDRTLAYCSSDPLRFVDAGRIDVDLDEHCAEIVQDGSRTWITGGGWGRGGLTIRPLEILRAASTTGTE
ncbi:family 43 glycosylhydrolase [Brachybacterium sp. P6-10-X1]|uniref:family 43 glycosylhydrolase n=1 Tax=Brachybacterium sp. P6-10-X1 TaxID=1903186 RepID=UPI0012F84777|nr:family 43 glycosylhydrolase [Brachybacterium sp. P6-10-X1]